MLPIQSLGPKQHFRVSIKSFDIDSSGVSEGATQHCVVNVTESLFKMTELHCFNSGADQLGII